MFTSLGALTFLVGYILTTTWYQNQAHPLMNLQQKTQPNVWVKDDVMLTPLLKSESFKKNQNASTLGKHVYFNRKTQELSFL